MIFRFSLTGIEGLDVYFLRAVATAAKLASSLAEDTTFVSEGSPALYLLPAILGGAGVNIISHVLIKHLDEANKLFKQDHENS
ncbi:hypothetical protein ACO0LC_07915 [Undibacterium sp. JH2W]|uniref:hypothetical protein n=1 Tax=Undibacterium sp. JH2W TaxID=3413037 RepID=UPI003BF40A2D